MQEVPSLLTVTVFRVHYPLPLPYVGKPDPRLLQSTIRQLQQDIDVLKQQVIFSFISRLFWVDLIKWVSNVRLSICTYLHMYVHAYVGRSIKSFFDFNEIWCVGRGRWVMHDVMQYDPIQGQGHEPLKVESWKSFYFQKLSPLPFTIGAGKWPLILN